MKEVVDPAAHAHGSLYRAMLDVSLDAIVAVDDDGLVVEFNPAAETLFGHRRDDVLGRPLRNIVPPELRDLHEPLENGASAILGQRLRLDAMRADGSRLPVEIAITRVEAERLFVGFIRDMTEVIAAESELGAAEARYRGLVENIPLVAYVNDVQPSFTPLYISPRVEELLGYTVEEWKANPRLAYDGIHPDDRERVLELARWAREHERPIQHEFRFIARDGRIVWVLDHTLPIRGSDGTTLYYQGFLLDITANKQLEEQLRHGQKMEAVGRLAGGIAHDFNNMLTAITGYAELLELSFERDDARLHDLGELKRAAGHAAALTRQLLAFSRKQTLLPQRLDVNDVVRGLESILGRTIGEGIELVTELSPELAEVEADPDQLVQVVLNIALNARDAMPRGGRLTISTARVEVDGAPQVAITIADDGAGMDEATRLRVFEPFFTTKDTGKGTGLGLATAYGVVSQSGGRIEVASQPGEGSTFVVLLPHAAAAERLAA